MPQHVTVVDYDPSWPQLFREERDRLCGALDPAAREVEVLLDYESRRTARLGELVPEWWADARMAP